MYSGDGNCGAVVMMLAMDILSMWLLIMVMMLS